MTIIRKAHPVILEVQTDTVPSEAKQYKRKMQISNVIRKHSKEGSNCFSDSYDESQTIKKHLYQYKIDLIPHRLPNVLLHVQRTMRE